VSNISDESAERNSESYTRVPLPEPPTELHQPNSPQGQALARGAKDEVLFSSILYDADRAPDLPDQVPAPDFFVELNLDQVVATITAHRDEYNLRPFFHAPPPDLNTVYYRHAITQDLDQDSVLDFIKAFSSKMRSMREQLARLNKLHYRLQKEAVFLGAIGFYCDAVAQLSEDLNAADLKSSGLIAFRRHVEDYVQSPVFSALESKAKEIKSDLASIEYELFIGNSSVTARKFESEPDYGAKVAATFERFKQGSVKDYDFKLIDFFDMNHVEARILDFVAALYPDIFGRLDQYFNGNQTYLEPGIERWDREIQFYVSYLDYIRPLKNAGLQFSYPELSATSKAVQATGTFDIALANKLVGEHNSVITNDFELGGQERIFVVSGPNQGGKTTFARTFGQLHYLGRLGLPVPGVKVVLFFFDEMLTQFEKEENIHNHRGKLEDDLVRIHEVLRRATPHSIIILNEIFTSTTLSDALFLARRVLDRIIELDLLCVCVTFMDELSTLSPQTVSLVSTVVPDNPAERTYRVIRKKADGRSYAMSIAEKYRVTYESLKERLAS
jgi:DNA mismatch repair protein MutS